jgi:hypothetical protein
MKPPVFNVGALFGKQYCLDASLIKKLSFGRNLWLDPAFRDTISVSEMLKPFDARLMSRYPVSNRVNHVLNDDADCAKPIEQEPSPTQGQLF